MARRLQFRVILEPVEVSTSSVGFGCAQESVGAACRGSGSRMCRRESGCGLDPLAKAVTGGHQHPSVFRRSTRSGQATRPVCPSRRKRICFTAAAAAQRQLGAARRFLERASAASSPPTQRCRSPRRHDFHMPSPAVRQQGRVRRDQGCPPGGEPSQRSAGRPCRRATRRAGACWPRRAQAPAAPDGHRASPAPLAAGPSRRDPASAGPWPRACRFPTA